MSKVNESIVLVGGGGGVYRIARFLKHTRSNITTIQTVFDHGGHSGELRDERGVLPPGDIRQAILALSDDNLEPALRQLMGYRFRVNGNSSLDRATVGNILLTALTEIEGDLPRAINALCRICHVRGKVLPVSLDNADLCAILSDGDVIVGEGNIDTRPIDDDRTIVKVFLNKRANIFVGAYDALVKADKIVFCPGDIYTSLIPNLLVDGFCDAVRESKAKLVYCVNIMTKKAETDGFNVGRFSSEVSRYLGEAVFDVVLYNNECIHPDLEDGYKKEKSSQVMVSGMRFEFAKEYLGGNFVDEAGGVIRHHHRIASAIANL